MGSRRPVKQLEMASKSIARSLLRQQQLSNSRSPIANLAAVKSSLGISTARRRITSKRGCPLTVPVRPFSTSRQVRYARVEESLDFRDQERESDEVDVCIVGGGIHSTCSSDDFD